MDKLLEQLSIADPAIADRVRLGLEKKQLSHALQSQTFFADDVIWALSMERSFGEAVADGYLEMAEDAEPEQIATFHHFIRDAGEKGPTFGKIMATSLVPTLKTKNSTLLESFMDTIKVMLGIGEYTLPPCLAVFSFLVKHKELVCSFAFLELLTITFGKELTYNRGRYLSNIIPKTIQSFQPEKRAWQTKEFSRVLEADYHLVDSFVDAMKKDLGFLHAEALHKFISQALDIAVKNKKAGARFLALESKAGMDACADLQQTIPLQYAARQLNRYIKARTGLGITVKPLSSISAKKIASGLTAVSDAHHIYLPDEIDFFSKKKDNLSLYKLFTKLELGYHEFGTFDFDFEKAVERIGEHGGFFKTTKGMKQPEGMISDLERFFSLFDDQKLSRDLFTIYEQGRLRILVQKTYPGITRKAMPVLKNETDRNTPGDTQGPDFMNCLYRRISLGFTTDKKGCPENIARLFEGEIEKNPTVETSALFVFKTYREMEKSPFFIPFGLRPRPNFYFMSARKQEELSQRIKARLETYGIKVFRSDIKQKLRETKNRITEEDIRSIIIHTKDPKEDDSRAIISKLEESGIDFSDEINKLMPVEIHSADEDVDQYRYREWDTNLGDYLQDHVIVRERDMDGCGNGWYGKVLEKRKGIVRRIRRSFEFLKPQGLRLLRKWPEGDEFDYRAMLDFAVDKKSGIMPSDRLYIKRIKQERDVSVLVLMDLSRSTANRVTGSQQTVLDVEKEAIVLLCEALTVVGDVFSIAGFSGNGRLGVDYYDIKCFNDAMDENVKQKIGAMSPQRSTRMGAAIRHATHLLENVPSKIRLLMIIGDGFPNDVGYKEEYATEDTRKALSEARAKGIYAHSITVNIACDSKLDDLYGRINHNVISDVRELPDRLLRIYSLLTR
jgi:nitric oxide reductase NorD protein